MNSDVQSHLNIRNLLTWYLRGGKMTKPMKPHEETWTASLFLGAERTTADVACIDPVDPREGRVIFEGTESIPKGRDEIKTEQYARAKLAAQAPAMARLLLSMREDPTGEVQHDLAELEHILRDAGVIS